MTNETRLETVRAQVAHLVDHVLPVLDKAVLLIPKERLNFRAFPEGMTVKELAYHVYQVIYLLTRATEQGEFLTRDVGGIPFHPEQAEDPRDIVSYGRTIRDYLRLAVTRFNAEHMQRAVARGPRASGFETMMLAVEEAIHHRGQLFVYLRLMGIKPPYLYDYS